MSSPAPPLEPEEEQNQYLEDDEEEWDGEPESSRPFFAFPGGCVTGCLPGCFFGVLFTFFFLSVMGYVLGSLVPGVAPGANTLLKLEGSDLADLQETVIHPGTGKKKIVIISVSGVIHSGKTPFSNQGSETILRQIRKVAGLPDLGAVVLEVNSPGGEVTATDEIYHAIRKLRRTTGVPVVCCMRTLAASGGYYVAAAADYIVANRLTITGSIGVLIGGYNYGELLKKVGVKSELYTSGKYKDFLNMGRERTPEERALVQNMVDDTFTEFAKVVAESRHLNLDEVRALQAKVFSGREAKRLHLVDSLGYMEDAIAQATKMGKLTDPPVVRYQVHRSLLQMLLARSAAPTPLVKIEGLESLTLRRGVLYFLYPLAF